PPGSVFAVAVPVPPPPRPAPPTVAAASISPDLASAARAGSVASDAGGGLRSAVSFQSSSQVTLSLTPATGGQATGNAVAAVGGAGDDGASEDDEALGDEEQARCGGGGGGPCVAPRGRAGGAPAGANVLPP